MSRRKRCAGTRIAAIARSSSGRSLNRWSLSFFLLGFRLFFCLLRRVAVVVGVWGVVVSAAVLRAGYDASRSSVSS
jgi:hypothetical protein